MVTTKRRTRYLSVIMLILMLLSSSMTVFASGISTEDYWNDKAQQIVNGVTLVDSDDLAKRLSKVAGKGQFTQEGITYYTVWVSSGGAAYAGGQDIRNSDGTPNIPDSTDYTSIPVKAMPSSAGPTANVTVMVSTKADAQALQKVQGNVSSGLLNQANVTPDTGTAMGLLSGVMPMINTLLGLLVVVISVGMTVFSALDIIYLAFPAFRSMIDTKVESGGRGTKTNKDGSTSSRWVTDDARLAMQDADQTQGSPWGPYFKRRVLAYIFLAIILFILLTGNIFAITTLVTNALQGLFNSLGL